MPIGLPLDRTARMGVTHYGSDCHSGRHELADIVTHAGISVRAILGTAHRSTKRCRPRVLSWPCSPQRVSWPALDEPSQARRGASPGCPDPLSGSAAPSMSWPVRFALPGARHEGDRRKFVSGSAGRVVKRRSGGRAGAGSARSGPLPSVRAEVQEVVSTEYGDGQAVRRRWRAHAIGE